VIRLDRRALARSSRVMVGHSLMVPAGADLSAVGRPTSAAVDSTDDRDPDRGRHRYT
jgi:hypothetical protein